MSGSNTENVSAFSGGGRFDGFVDADYDAYVAKKQTSNAYTLGRRRAKDKLLALAHAVAAELGDDLQGLELLGSDEAPTVANGRRVEAQWAYFIREPAARTALKPLLQTTNLHAGANLFDIAVEHQHASLTLRLDDVGLRVGLEVAPKAKVDRENIAVKLSDEDAVPEFLELCEALPGEATLGPGSARVPALDVTADVVESWLAPLREDGTSFAAELQLARDEPVLATQALIGTVVQLVSTFVDLYRFTAWSPENDHARVKAEIKKSVNEKTEAVAATFSAGARVTILAGLFAGRSGYLAEISKGKAKVMVGPVSVGVELKDIKSA